MAAKDIDIIIFFCIFATSFINIIEGLYIESVFTDEDDDLKVIEQLSVLIRRTEIVGFRTASIFIAPRLDPGLEPQANCPAVRGIDKFLLAESRCIQQVLQFPQHSSVLLTVDKTGIFGNRIELVWYLDSHSVVPAQNIAVIKLQRPLRLPESHSSSSSEFSSDDE